MDKREPVWTWQLFSKFFCLEEKITHLNIWKGFGGILEEPNIWLFGFWLFEQVDELRRTPIIDRILSHSAYIMTFHTKPGL